MSEKLETQLVYAVVGESGNYSDYEMWLEAVFEDEMVAKGYAFDLGKQWEQEGFYIDASFWVQELKMVRSQPAPPTIHEVVQLLAEE